MIFDTFKTENLEDFSNISPNQIPTYLLLNTFTKYYITKK